MNRYQGPKGRSNTVLQGKSKHFTNLKAFDLRDLYNKENVATEERLKNLGLKPWLDLSQSKLNHYFTQNNPGIELCLFVLQNMIRHYMIEVFGLEFTNLLWSRVSSRQTS